MNLLLAIGLLIGGSGGGDAVGQPVDIAPSAYLYRADRKADANPPESWIALKHYANLPLNKPIDLNNRDIKHALCGLLWEEIRPVQTLELTWPVGSKHRPSPDALTLNLLINHGASSSWWNNLDSVTQAVTPTVSADGRTYSYALGQNTCGLVVGVTGGQDAAKMDVPQVRALVPDRWKQMDVEIEWGFDKDTTNKDYSGRLEAYDGRISDVQALNGDSHTAVRLDGSWQSSGETTSRRGIKMSLLYMGTSKWRKEQQYTTQPDDVARTIVTVWTKSGNFSFRASDLENGPILAPEFGFFVRRTSSSPLPREGQNATLQVIPTPLKTRMDSIAGDNAVKGWGSNDTPWVGTNPTDQARSPLGINLPAKSFAMHPGQYVDVVAEWRSPIKGFVSVDCGIQHAQTLADTGWIGGSHTIHRAAERQRLCYPPMARAGSVFLGKSRAPDDWRSLCRTWGSDFGD